MPWATAPSTLGKGIGAVAGSLHADQHGDHTGYAVDRAAEEKRFHAITQDDTEQCGFTDAQQGRYGCTGTDSADLFLSGLNGDGKTYAGRGKAAHTQNSVERVKAGAGKQADLQHVEYMMYACKGDDGPEEAYNETTDAQRKFQCIFYDD